MCFSRRSRGFSLLEVVVFIVVLGIAIAGIALLYNQVTRTSVDPLIRKQALQLATSLLEEIQLRPYTYCDPDEPAVYTAAAATTAECGGVATHVENIGPENFGGGAEDRYTAARRFDNVNDYDGFTMGAGVAAPNDGIQTADSTVINALSDYRVAVGVAAIGANELGAAIPVTEGLRITVTATHVPTGIAVQLQGYRVRYAPNSP